MFCELVSSVCAEKGEHMPAQAPLKATHVIMASWMGVNFTRHHQRIKDYKLSVAAKRKKLFFSE